MSVCVLHGILSFLHFRPLSGSRVSRKTNCNDRLVIPDNSYRYMTILVSYWLLVCPSINVVKLNHLSDYLSKSRAALK